MVSIKYFRVVGELRSTKFTPGTRCALNWGFCAKEELQQSRESNRHATSRGNRKFVPSLSANSQSIKFPRATSRCRGSPPIRLSLRLECPRSACAAPHRRSQRVCPAHFGSSRSPCPTPIHTVPRESLSTTAQTSLVARQCAASHRLRPGNTKIPV